MAIEYSVITNETAPNLWAAIQECCKKSDTHFNEAHYIFRPHSSGFMGATMDRINTSRRDNLLHDIKELTIATDPISKNLFLGSVEKFI